MALSTLNFQLNKLFKVSAPRHILVEGLELIALALQPLQAHGQCRLQFVDALEGVMEGDDGPVACVFTNVLEHLVGIQACGVVARDEVPHDNRELMAQEDILSVSHKSVRRPEKTGVDQLVGLQHIQHIAAGAGQPLDVVVGVVANAVTPALDFLEQLGVFPHVVAHHEEGGLRIVFVQRVENPGSGLRDGPVVEGEVNRLLVRVHSPYSTGIEPSQPLRRLFYDHL